MSGSVFPSRRVARRLWLVVHRWLGLTAGLLFVLVGLTGSLLVFDHAIDEWLNPDLLLSEHRSVGVPAQTIIESAERSYGASAIAMTKPRIDGGVWTVWFQSGNEELPHFTQVLVDPATAEVTGQRVWGEYLMSWIYRLHFRLLAGEPGGVVVGLIGIAAMLSIVSGIYLWWPLWRHSWRAALQVRPGKRVYDVHKSFGIFACVILFVIAFTGATMAFPNAFRILLASVGSLTEPPAELQSSSAAGAQSLTADQAITVAQRSFPDAQFDHLHPPADETGFYEVAFRQTGEVQQSFGRSQVFLDQYSGEVLAIRSPDAFTALDTFHAWQFPLHNGEALGLAGRWLVFFSGLMPAVLYVTGCWIWWKRRGRSKRHA